MFPDSVPHPDVHGESHLVTWQGGRTDQGKINTFCLCHSIFKNFESCIYHKQKTVSIPTSYC